MISAYCIQYLIFYLEVDYMHAIEKIFSRASKRDEVVTGEIVTAAVEFAEINDLYLQTIYSFFEMNGKKVWDPID